MTLQCHMWMRVLGYSAMKHEQVDILLRHDHKGKWRTPQQRVLGYSAIKHELVDLLLGTITRASGEPLSSFFKCPFILSSHRVNFGLLVLAMAPAEACALLIRAWELVLPFVVHAPGPPRSWRCVRPGTAPALR